MLRRTVVFFRRVKIHNLAGDMQERASILRMHTAAAPLSPEVDLQAVTAACQGFSGADLAALAREAAMAAISEAAKPLLSGMSNPCLDQLPCSSIQLAYHHGTFVLVHVTSSAQVLL